MSEKIAKSGWAQSLVMCCVFSMQFHCVCIKSDSQVRVHILYSLCLSARDSDNKGELTYSCSHRTWWLSRSNISDVAGTYNSGLAVLRINITKRSIEWNSQLTVGLEERGPFQEGARQTPRGRGSENKFGSFLKADGSNDIADFRVQLYCWKTLRTSPVVCCHHAPSIRGLIASRIILLDSVPFYSCLSYFCPVCNIVLV